MYKKAIISTIVLISALLLMASCSSTPRALSAEEAVSAIDSIRQGEKKTIYVTGRIQQTESKFPKARGLWEMKIGQKTMYLAGKSGQNFELNGSYLNKMISAEIEVSHLPLATSHPATQRSGCWITKVKNVKLLTE